MYSYSPIHRYVLKTCRRAEHAGDEVQLTQLACVIHGDRDDSKLGGHEQFEFNTMCSFALLIVEHTPHVQAVVLHE